MTPEFLRNFIAGREIKRISKGASLVARQPNCANCRPIKLIDFSQGSLKKTSSQDMEPRKEPGMRAADKITARANVTVVNV